MPSGIVIDLIERVAKLEAKVGSLLTYQKWSMALLSAVFILAISTIVRGR